MKIDLQKFLNESAFIILIFIVVTDCDETMVKMTMTRALVELKTLDKRITKHSDECEVLRVRQRNDKWDVSSWSKDATAQLQSVLALIARRDLIKAKIIQSNAMTKVKLGDASLTVAEIIDKKQNLPYKQHLLAHLRLQRSNCTSVFDQKEAAVRAKLDRLLELEFGKEGKSNSGNIATISDTYLAANKVELLDPTEIDKQIKQLEHEVEEIDKESNLLLSESNATTTIDLDD